MYLNDEDMALNKRKIEMYETNFQTYREGASGANGGKVGGGCGCNQMRGEKSDHIRCQKSDFNIVL